jgi:hypothetical protein
MLTEERFEGIEIALPELIQYDVRSLRHLSSLSSCVYGSAGRKVTRKREGIGS